MSSEGVDAVTDAGAQAQGLVPKLRFPEFRDAGAWEDTTIGGIGSFYYGKSAPKWSLEENAPTKCVRYGELYTKFGAVITETVSRTNIDPQNLRFSKGGEILVPRVGEKPEDFGQCCSLLTLPNIAIGEMISVFETTEVPLFYTYYFRKMYREFASVVEGQNVKNLYYTELEPLAICRPTKPEQQKIADCLSSLDAVIAAEGDRLAALKDHKKGLMQQLFPAKDQTTPRLRFPEFENAGEWEEQSLAQISPAIFDGTHQTPTYTNEGVPFFSVENLVSGANNKFISQADYNVATAKNKPELGDVLITRIGKIGFSKVVDWTGDFSVYVTLAVVKKSNLFNSGYLHACFQSDRYQTEIAQRSLLNAVPAKINMDELRKSVVLLPSMPEQNRIAACFQDCDNLIDAQIDKLAVLKTHKKALMQQLFPSPAQATA